jgi:hypothetical protein
MWIENGDKYALVGLEVKLEGAPPPAPATGELWALTGATFEVPPEWREWLGSIRTEEVAGCNLFLATKIASAAPDILDAENQTLEQRVWHFYVGLLLSAMFSPSHRPVLLTGARRDGVIGIRQHKDLELPVPQVFRPYPALVVADLLSAARLAHQLGMMSPAAIPNGLWRFFRTLHIYIETRAVADLPNRIHQYCRCIDGLILPDIGKTKRQFKSRTELFIGPGHHHLMGALYYIRSHVEHLHEDRYLEVFDRTTRLDLVQKEAVIEYVVRETLARIVGQDALWMHFGNTTALEKFWAVAPDERRKLWGDPINPLTAIADFDAKRLHDGHLGKT